MRGARITVLIVSVISGAVTIAAALIPQLNFAYRMPELRAALVTVAPLIALIAGFLIFGRLLRRARLTELTLACSLGALALSQLAFVTVPVLADRAWPDLSVWASQAGSTLGGALFALAAFVPRRRLRRLGLALGASGTALIAALLVIEVLAASFAADLPKVYVATAVPGPLPRPDLNHHVTMAAAEIALAAIYGVAAVGFLRRSERSRDEFFGWLAIAAVLAAASHLNYFLYPSLYSPLVSVGDAFTLCSYAVLLAGSAREIWSYWRALSEVAVLEERRRIARDLHDGLAQELAYLLRNLDSLDGPVEAETRARLLRAAERAQLEVRLVIDTLAASRRQSVNAAIAQAVGEVAARDHVRLELDVAPGICLPAGRADALVRIACEAVGNAARHSGDTRVSLSLCRQGPRVRLRISDHGSGFDPAGPAGGFGLISMRDRASSVGGDLRISSVPGRGTEVEATL